MAGTVETDGNLNLAPGVYKALTLKPGPIIGRVYPAASVVFPLSVAPGEFVAIYGDALAGSTATAASVNFPTQLADAAGDGERNGRAAVLRLAEADRRDCSRRRVGLVKLTVQDRPAVTP